jgi:hypothetical protein
MGKTYRRSFYKQFRNPKTKNVRMMEAAALFEIEEEGYIPSNRLLKRSNPTGVIPTSYDDINVAARSEVYEKKEPLIEPIHYTKPNIERERKDMDLITAVFIEGNKVCITVSDGSLIYFFIDDDDSIEKIRLEIPSLLNSEIKLFKNDEAKGYLRLEYDTQVPSQVPSPIRYRFLELNYTPKEKVT